MPHYHTKRLTISNYRFQVLGRYTRLITVSVTSRPPEKEIENAQQKYRETWKGKHRGNTQSGMPTLHPREGKRSERESGTDDFYHIH